MERGPTDQYSQSDPASAAQYSHHQQDVRPSTQYPTTPAGPEYGVNPTSARSSTLNPDYLARGHPGQQYNPAGAGTMAQATSPSLSLQDGQGQNDHNPSNMKSNPEVPIDPSIAQTSPTYPQYSPYGQGHDMSHYPQGQPQPGHYYPQHYAGHPQGFPGAYSSPGTGVSASAAGATAGPRGQYPYPPPQVYSFVPIPGAQQHKRPRRRYEEIERMYKCGWQGCEKAYGTLNHLNAHVTMQSHGQKRTPEEFKEIRKEWKARKKEEDTARKTEEDRQRSTGGPPSVDGQTSEASQPTPTAQSYAPGVQRQLPPIGYQPASGGVGPQYASAGVEQGIYQSNGQPMAYGGYPNSPYTGQPMP